VMGRYARRRRYESMKTLDFGRRHGDLCLSLGRRCA
jgi:hypothetical protein